ncbi:hypothetical protein HKD37_13G035554 [Glycine soja]
MLWWRDLAAQVAPPMMEKEMITIIVDTLPVFYYEKMVGYAPSSFTDLVFVVGMKRGKYDHPALMNAKTGANKEDENEGETLAMTVIPTRSNFPSAQQCHYSANNSPSHPIIHKGYDSNATCAYHGGVPGHSIEHCMTLKRKVQSLINAGWLKFEENRL